MYDENSNAIMAMNAAAVAAAAAAAAAGASANGSTIVSNAATTTPNSVTANGNGLVNASPHLNSTHLTSQFLMSKDSRWLQLEVCREFQRGQCSRTEKECKFAHPPPHVDIQNGRVTACYDSIKGRCTRENPKCKYLHPPQHLKDQLVINGRQHLQLKNQICSQLTPATIAPSMPLVAQFIQQQQPSQILPTTLSYQYFQQLPGGLYPALIQNTNATAGIDPFQLQTANNANNGIPPMKRTAFDNNNALNAMTIASNNNAAALAAAVNGSAAPFPFYAAQAAATQFNPYMQSIQIPATYLPAVSFNGSIPPRF